MALDDDIVQDFLLEGGEILERLDAQLVQLELAPAEPELLNAVFRAFHTIKGGAGFLGLEHLVTLSHKAEDLFDLLRNGALRIDAGLMDQMLQVLDVLRAMFEQLRRQEAPNPAPAELLARLMAYAEGGSAPTLEVGDFLDVTGPHGVVGPDDVTVINSADALMAQIVDDLSRGVDAGAGQDQMTEQEFDALLDQLQAKPKADPSASAPAAVPAGSDLITDDEFEALLDDLHGAGQFRAPATTAEPPPAAPRHAPAPPRATPAQAAVRHEPPKDTTVRVETATLDRIMNMVGELVLIRNRLTNLQSVIGDEAVSQTVANLDMVTSDLQMAAMKTRMQPIRKVFGRFPRVVRDLARSLEKEVELEMAGEDTELDKNLVEALSDPLVHLVRNAVDHGIEVPAARLAAGKTANGRLRLAAAQAGDQIVLTIADDGKGIDAEALRRKAVVMRLLDADAAERLSDRECYELIFLPGFSTKAEISDISGRGVGMDVVKTRIAQINGSIEIDSVLGRGTSIRISVPLTLAIMPTLMIVLGTQTFALPLGSVQEIIHFERGQAREVDGRKTMVVRGKALPLFYLSRWLVRGINEFTEQRGHVVIVRVGNQSVGLLVDELIGQEEVVIKPLGALLSGTKGLAGATITGNGKIALILDLPGLIESYAHR